MDITQGFLDHINADISISMKGEQNSCLPIQTMFVKIEADAILEHMR